MKIDLIEDFETFKTVRADWEAVHQADPQALFFLSWAWLSGCLERLGEPWLILAAKPTAPTSSYVSFFPLKILTIHEDEGGFCSQLHMAASSISDYTGYICLPDYEEEVAAAFAECIEQQLVWAALHLENIPDTDTRINLFLRCFSRDSFELSQRWFQNQDDGVNNYICPYVPLATDWQQYLQNSLSSNTRQKLRRLLKKIENSDEFHITHVNEQNLERHIEILLTFWEAKWGPKKGDTCPVILNSLRATLRHSFKIESLYFPVLWQGEKPLGAIANLMDKSRKIMFFYVGSRDETVKTPPPGLVLHADAIRYAIENGFVIYNFLRGNEDYKFSFGAKERQIRHIVVEPKPGVCQRRFDVRALPAVVQQSMQQHRANQLAAAEQGYRQILEIQPDHLDALYGLGILMRQQGELQIAEELLKQLLQTQPKFMPAWFSLGNLYQTEGRFAEAVQVYRQALALQPNSVAVHNNLGYALQQQGHWEEAIACYQQALTLQPDCTEADVNWANALHALGKLPADQQAHYAQVNHELATRCQQAGNLATAIVHYRQAIALNPDLPEVHDQLELALQAQAECSQPVLV